MKRISLTLASTLIVLMVFIVPTHASSIVIGGGLRQSEADQLVVWLGQWCLQLTTIFSGIDSFSFHAAADGQGRTFTVSDVQRGSALFRIGGYDPRSWESIYDYHYTV